MDLVQSGREVRHALSVPRHDDRHAAPRSVKILAVVLGTFGVAVRVWVLGRHAINADEAVVGLMAEQILHGHFSAFYWGQDYGGGEPYVVALVFSIFGQSTFTLGLTPVLLDAVAAVLVWRIGRRLFGPQIGIEAAILFWIWPEVYIWQSTIEYGFRWFVLDVGLGALLLTLRVIGQATRHRRIEVAGVGLLLGAGWWGSPEIMYFVCPIVAFLIYSVATKRFHISFQELLVAGLAAIVGASAWLEANLRSHFASLHSGVQPNPGMLDHLKVFVGHTLPILLGLQLRVSGRWLFGRIVGPGVEVLVLALAVVLLAVLIRRREAIVILAFAIFAPLIYALSPFTWYWADGRYAVFLAPVIALLTAVGAREVFATSAVKHVLGKVADVIHGPLVMLVCLCLTVAAISQLAPYRPNGVAATGSSSWTSWKKDPSSGFVAIAAEIRREHITDVYAGYWVAYPLMFASSEKLVSSDISYVRSAPIYWEVADNPKSAWLFLNPARYRAGVALTGVSLMDPSCAGRPDRCLLPSEFEDFVHAHHLSYKSYDIGPFIAIIPSRPISPVSISTAYGLREPFVEQA